MRMAIRSVPSRPSCKIAMDISGWARQRASSGSTACGSRRGPNCLTRGCRPPGCRRCWPRLTAGCGSVSAINPRSRISPGALQKSIPCRAQDRLPRSSRISDGTLWTVAAFSLFHRAGGQWMRVPVSRDTAEVRVHDVGLSRNGGLLISTDRGLFEATARRSRLPPARRWLHLVRRRGTKWQPVGHRHRGGIQGGRRGSAPRAVADALGGGYRLMFDRDGQAWLGTIAEGLWRVRLNGGQRAFVEKATLRSASFNDAVQSLFEDRDGNVWVGTTAGLHRLNRQLLQLAPIDGDRDQRRVDQAGRSVGVHAVRPRAARIHRRRLDGDEGSRDHGGRQTDGTRQARIGVDHVQCRGPWSSRRQPGGSFPDTREFGLRPRLSFLAADPEEGIWIGDGEHVLHWNGREFSGSRLASATSRFP